MSTTKKEIQEEIYQWLENNGEQKEMINEILEGYNKDETMFSWFEYERQITSIIDALNCEGIIDFNIEPHSRECDYTLEVVTYQKIAKDLSKTIIWQYDVDPWLDGGIEGIVEWIADMQEDIEHYFPKTNS